jgi:hypothetical protein
MCLMLSGCTAQKAQNIHFVWSNGRCIMVAEGISIESAKQMSKSWTFEDCKVEMTNNEGVKK